MNLDFAAWNRETIRNRAKSLKAAAKPSTDKKRKKKRSRAEIVQKEDCRSSKLKNNVLNTELHEGMMLSGEKEFLGNGTFLDNDDEFFHDGGFFGMGDLSNMSLEDAIPLNDGK